MKITHVGELANPASQAYGKKHRMLLEKCQAAFIIDSRKVVKIDIVSGTKWDGMSIPAFAWSIVGTPFGPTHELAGLIHDELYKGKHCTRKEADMIMLYILKQKGENWFKRRTMYRAVRLFGRSRWQS